MSEKCRVLASIASLAISYSERPRCVCRSGNLDVIGDGLGTTPGWRGGYVFAAVVAAACVSVMGLPSPSPAESPRPSDAPATSWRWHKPERLDNAAGGLASISCPSLRLCVGVDAKGHVLVSKSVRHAAGSWKRTGARVPTGPLTCPSATLCLVPHGHNLVVSRRPSGGSSSWTRITVDPTAGLTSVSCPGNSLCVAVDERDRALVTTSPTGPASGWTSAPIDPGAARSPCRRRSYRRSLMSGANVLRRGGRRGERDHFN